MPGCPPAHGNGDIQSHLIHGEREWLGQDGSEGRTVPGGEANMSCYEKQNLPDVFPFRKLGNISFL